jgi:peptide/nickel transport system permease protein
VESGGSGGVDAAGAAGAMLKYLTKRFFLMFPTLLGVAIVTFFLIRVIPGDVVELRMGGESGAVSQEMLAKERARFGLDQPLWKQFVVWVGGVARLDFGRSMWTGAPIWEEIKLRLSLSLQVAIMATVVAVLLAIPLGVLAALKQDTWVDYAVRIFSIAGLATPSFWLGIVFILMLLIVFKWLPPMVYTPFWQNPWQNMQQLIWPALAVGYRYSAVVARMVRSSIIEVMKEDYIRTARAKGVYERMVVMRHAMRNALLPAITVIGLEFAFLIGGLVVTEQVFNLNGIGRLFVQAVARNDFTLIQTMVMLIAVVFIVVNLAVDLLYAVFDPRIRYR